MEISNHVLKGQGITNLDTTNKGGAITPEYLIIHFTAGRSALSSVEHLCDPTSQASAHLVISRDGKIWQLVPFNQKAWHAGVSAWAGRSGLNGFSIGIELDNAGKLQKIANRYQAWFGAFYPETEVIAARHKHESESAYWHAFTEPQISAALEVGRLLVNNYELRDVLGHDDIAPERKVDPGPAFPMASFRSSVFGRRQDEPLRYVVMPELLNLRSGPGTAYPSVGPPLPRGARLTLIEMRAEWAKVTCQNGSGRNGWVRNAFVEQSG